MDSETTDETPFTISIEGPGVKVRKSVSERVAGAVTALVMTGDVQAAAAAPGSAFMHKAEDQSGPGSFSMHRAISLREFLDERQAVRNPDKITAIAEYIERYETAQGFTKEDIRAKFRSAGEGPPGNYHRDFAWALASGWIAEDPANADTFFVTKKGKAAVEGKFAKELQKPQGRRVRRRSYEGLGT